MTTAPLSTVSLSAAPVSAVPPSTAVRSLTESRPPCRRWSCAGLLAPATGTAAAAEVPASPRRPRQSGTRVLTVRSGWTATADAELPDAAGWSRSLAVAMVEALLSRRPVAQLNRWLSEDVLASVTLQQRRRRPGSGSNAVPRLISARVQHPAPRVAEVAAFLGVGRRPMVLAFRLEGFGARWLCTALEVGPPPEGLGRSVRGQDDPEAAEGESQQRVTGA